MIAMDGVYTAYYLPTVDGVYWVSMDVYRGTGEVSSFASGQPYSNAMPIDQGNLNVIMRIYIFSQ